MIPNRSRYLASLSDELKAQATRVRDLIGDAHWLSDGHHKEYLVKHTISRHIPSAITVSRGFVVHPRRHDLISREQDLVFIDTSYQAPIFDQGGLCVALPSQVLAAVAIKTTLGKQELDDACSTLHSLRRVVSYAGAPSPPWCGVLFFEADNTKTDHLCEKVGRLISAFEKSAETLPNMRSTPDVVAVARTAGFLVDTVEAASSRISIRGFVGDGTVLLLNSLLTHLASARGSSGSELESFISAFEMDQLPGSPFCDY